MRYLFKRQCEHENRRDSFWSCFIVTLLVIVVCLGSAVYLGERVFVVKMAEARLERQKPKVFTHQQWERLFTTRYSHASVEDISSGRRINFADSEISSAFRNVFKALIGENCHSVTMVETNAQYVVSWQAGMDPAVVQVILSKRKVFFYYRGFWYCGGDADLFKKAIEAENME